MVAGELETKEGENGNTQGHSERINALAEFSGPALFDREEMW